MPVATDFVKRIRDNIAKARECILKAQSRYASYANKSRKDVSFAEGDQVMLHSKNISMRGTRKLLPRWLGPFRIERVVNPVAYKLALPKSMGKVHNVFHVWLLKKYHADAARATFVPFVPALAEDGTSIEEVERILDHRDVKRTRGGKGRKTKVKVLREYLVSWQGRDRSEATWLPEEDLMAQAEEMVSTYRKSIGKVIPAEPML